MTPKLLIAGHIVKDVTADGWRLGGGVLYAAAQASRLGVDTAVVTACAGDIAPAALLPDVTWQVQKSEATTTFENIYHDGHRDQRLLARGQTIDLAALPVGWLDAQIISLTPLFHEIEPLTVTKLLRSGSLVGVAAQGWLRELDGDHVRPAAFEESPSWLSGDVVFVSDEDVRDADSVAVWAKRVPIVALTRGRSGCTVWNESDRHDVTAAVVREEDPTGAGDVFAMAFLVRFDETHDVVESARFAAAAGALSVRGQGYEAVASRDEIEALLKLGQVKVAG
ncbi:MAG TPA: PfkB family carbohydrate kinase [Dehalococcoidia bacterium]|nr:PfkB family carbohydrate kinase [Dehalococcoidia bacterium]